MNKNEMVDDLLQAVSDELKAGYEAKNLDGKTLRGVYEEYKVVSAKREKMKPNLHQFLTLVSEVVVVAAILAVLYFTNSVVLTGFFAVAAVASLYFVNKIFLDKAWEYNKTIAQCENVLDDFWRAVKALDPKWHVGDVLTEENARETLIGYALRLLDAEGRTKETRMKERVSTWELRDSANWEDKSRDEFEKMLSTAEKFGLVYAKKHKDEFFAEAQKRLNKYK